MQIAGFDKEGLFHSPLYGIFTGKWKMPIILSITLHLGLLFTAMVSPMFFNVLHRDAEVYTVALYSMEDVQTAPAPPPVTQKQPAPQPVKEVPSQSSEPLSTAVPITIPEQSAPRQPRDIISLKPLKTKVKIKKDTVEKEVMADRLKRSLNRVRAKVVQENANKEAKQEVDNALNTLRQMLQTGERPAAEVSSQTPAGSESGTSRSGKSNGTVGIASEAKRQYYAGLVYHIQQYWELPEMQQWDDSLEAHVVVFIRRDGSIRKTFFEKKSDNMYYNKFVQQALENASPLPPIPSILEEDEVEIGIRFRPGELF